MPAIEATYTGPPFSLPSPLAAPTTPGMCVWMCHLCARRWPMATRTCLECGHKRCTRDDSQPGYALFCPVLFDAAGGRAQFRGLPVSTAKRTDQTSRCETGSAGPSERRMTLSIRTNPRPAASGASTSPAGQRSSAASAAAPPPTRRPLPSLPPSSPASAEAMNRRVAIRVSRCRTGRVYKPSPLNPAWKPGYKFL